MDGTTPQCAIFPHSTTSCCDIIAIFDQQAGYFSMEILGLKISKIWQNVTNKRQSNYKNMNYKETFKRNDLNFDVICYFSKFPS